jgi:peptide/nickel transport system substrate-binding protein
MATGMPGRIISMRLTLVAVVVTLLAAACSSDDAADTSSSTEPVQSTTNAPVIASTVPPLVIGDGGVARIGVLESPRTLNPVAAGGTSPSSTMIQQATLPGAYVYDPVTWRTIPDLVVRIPTLDDGDVVLDRDRQSVTWTIDPKASWSDGTPVSGNDFAFTLRATLGITECGPLAGSTSAFGIEIADVEAKTITVEMPGPTLFYESMFSAIIPAHATTETDVCTDDGVGWPSAGPFLAGGMTADETVIVRNDDHWRTPPSMAAARFFAYESEAALVAAYESDEIDLVVTQDPETATAVGVAGATVVTQPLDRIEHLAFNFAIGGGEEQSLRRAVTFRQGVARAIDRRRLADVVNGMSVDGVLHGATPADPWSIYSHDVDEARRLVDVACDVNGRDCEADPPRLRLISSEFGGRPDMAKQIAADLAEVGIEVQVTTLTSVEMAESVVLRDWDIALLAISGHAGVATAADSLFTALDTERGDNVYMYGGDNSLAATNRSAYQLRLLAGQIGVSADLDRVGRLLGEAQGLLAADVVFIPLMARPSYTLVNEGRLEGVVANATPSRVTWNIADWAYNEE